MKILVLSDTHGDLRAQQMACELVQPDTILHLGDHWGDAQQLRHSFPNCEVYAVAGNCDFAPGAPLRLQLQLEGHCILLMHGHRYGVKASPLRAILAARESEAELLCFGHTHRALCEQQEGLWVLNPGSCSGPQASYGIVDTFGGALHCSIQTLGG